MIPLKKLAFWRRRFRAVEDRTRGMNRCELIKLICPSGQITDGASRLLDVGVASRQKKRNDHHPRMNNPYKELLTDIFDDGR